MESAQAALKINYIIMTTVQKVDEGIKIIDTFKKADGEIVQTKQVLGWFIQFEGSYEQLYMGKERPQLNKGDQVKITIERIDNAKETNSPPAA